MLQSNFCTMATHSMATTHRLYFWYCGNAYSLRFGTVAKQSILFGTVTTHSSTVARHTDPFWYRGSIWYAFSVVIHTLLGWVYNIAQSGLLPCHIQSSVIARHTGSLVPHLDRISFPPAVLKQSNTYFYSVKTSNILHSGLSTLLFSTAQASLIIV